MGHRINSSPVPRPSARILLQPHMCSPSSKHAGDGARCDHVLALARSRSPMPNTSTPAIGLPWAGGFCTSSGASGLHQPIRRPSMPLGVTSSPKPGISLGHPSWATSCGRAPRRKPVAVVQKCSKLFSSVLLLPIRRQLLNIMGCDLQETAGMQPPVLGKATRKLLQLRHIRPRLFRRAISCFVAHLPAPTNIWGHANTKCTPVTMATPGAPDRSRVCDR